MRTSAKEFLDCADDELFAFSNNELNNRPREGPAMTTTATTCGCGAATPRPTATPCSCASRTRAPSPTPQPDQRKTNHRSMAKFNRVLTPCATAHAIATCAPAFCVIASAGNHPRTTWLVPTLTSSVARYTSAKASALRPAFSAPRRWKVNRRLMTYELAVPSTKEIAFDNHDGQPAPSSSA